MPYEQNTLEFQVDNLPPEMIILKHWNKEFENIKEIGKIRKVDSTFKVGKEFRSLKSTLREALFKEYKMEDIKIAITNYKNVYISDSHYYKVKWNLGKFIYSGLTTGKGFILFLPENKPTEKFYSKDPLGKVKTMFTPITTKYENIMENNRYFGFSLKEVELYKLKQKRLDEHLESGNIDFEHFYILELVIAGILFNRKKDPNLKDLSRYMSLWSREKDKFKEQARKFLEW